MTDKLSLFNGALGRLGERALASLTENREPRRILDAIWANNTALKAVLEMGQWNFASRAALIPASPSVTPAFGFEYAYEKPADFVRTTHFCSDEFFAVPINQYQDVGGFWYSHLTEVYVKYVSFANDRGGDLTTWPQHFTDLAEIYLALKACPRIRPNATNMSELKDDLRVAKLRARSLDAMEGPTQAPKHGNWIQSRWGGKITSSRFTGRIY